MKSEPILFATAARGTEGAVRDELRDLGFRGVRADRGGVHFGRSLDEGFRACLELRTAIRVLYRLTTFEAQSGESLYDGVGSIDWTEWLTPQLTLAVRAVCNSSRLTHSQFVAQKTKDAVVDQLRHRLHARPSVHLEDPDVAIFVHVARDRATVYLDLTGSSLHRRGWRALQGEAPLKETLAAAVLRLAGWDRERPLIDPMCGAGTIAIEAATWASDLAPGLSRARFGFERWASFGETEAARMRELRERIRAQARAPTSPTARVRGSDVAAAALTAARENARSAGVTVEWTQASVRDLKSDDRQGFIMTNPPYGVRIDADEALYADMARAFGRLRGYRVAILAGTPAIARAMVQRPTMAHPIWNGDLECRLLVYDID